MPGTTDHPAHHRSAPAIEEVRPETTPAIPLPQNPALPRRALQRLVNLFPPGQFFRYLAVGGFNTVFGYSTFVLILSVLNRSLPPRYLSLTVILAAVLSTPLNITVAYFGYKLFVFRTRGNHLVEWLRCFAVYGSGMIPGLLALSALTRLLQTTSIHHQAALLSLPPLLAHLATAKTAPGNLAGAIVTGVSTIYSFVGHKKFSFKPPAKP